MHKMPHNDFSDRKGVPEGQNDDQLGPSHQGQPRATILAIYGRAVGDQCASKKLYHRASKSFGTSFVHLRLAYSVLIKSITLYGHGLYMEAMLLACAGEHPTPCACTKKKKKISVRRGGCVAAAVSTTHQDNNNGMNARSGAGAGAGAHSGQQLSRKRIRCVYKKKDAPIIDSEPRRPLDLTLHLFACVPPRSTKNRVDCWRNI
jgi:hypothetical protein